MVVPKGDSGGFLVHFLSNPLKKIYVYKVRLFSKSNILLNWTDAGIELKHWRSGDNYIVHNGRRIYFYTYHVTFDQIL